MASFRSENGRTIQDSFNEYHAANPAIYAEFKILALKAIAAGKKQISFKMILNVIRWQFFINTTPTLFDKPGRFSKFKINDAYSSRYARVFIQEFPQHTDKIELRELRS